MLIVPIFHDCVGFRLSLSAFPEEQARTGP
jgi:hypothetical protein